MKMTKLVGLTFLTILVISVSITSIYVYYRFRNEGSEEKFFFGVAYGQDTVEETKLLIDKVKNYTNLFIIDSYTITTNNTNPQVLNEICDYAAKANLHFIVYFFSFLSGEWQQEWLDTAKQTWGEKFLGIYLRDEPGGRQIDLAQTVRNASNYSEAADEFVQVFSSSFSMQFLHSKDVPVFTSDYALYWFDYLAGCDCVFVELVGTNVTSKIRQIDLCRGAADVQGKQWGAIITYTPNDVPPYLENGTAMLQDMLTAYHAGAKFIVVFNYPVYPETNPYGILTEDQFDAMKDFWNQTHSGQKSTFGTANAQVALVLPKDYGWGMRNSTDKIWGLWDSDSLSPLVWAKTNELLKMYELKLDVIYNDTSFDFNGKYSKIYY
jgi:hypothetical protein